MDFANAVCTPKNPGCTACPLAANCKALAEGAMTDYPVKAKKKSKPTRKGIAYVARNKAGDAFLVRRPPRGLLGGLLAFPSTGWVWGQTRMLLKVRHVHQIQHPSRPIGGYSTRKCIMSLRIFRWSLRSLWWNWKTRNILVAANGNGSGRMICQALCARFGTP
jgi:adenine-specific DNA glycosylase